MFERYENEIKYIDQVYKKESVVMVPQIQEVIREVPKIQFIDREVIKVVEVPKVHIFILHNISHFLKHFLIFIIIIHIMLFVIGCYAHGAERA